MRDTVAPVDQGLLDSVFKNNKSWVYVGAYETVSKSQAANGDELANHFALLQSLLHLQPKGELLLTQVRSAMLKVLTDNPKLNSSDMKNLLWAGGRYERVSTMLHHLTRAKNNEDKLRQLIGKASAPSAAKVKELLSLLSSEDVQSNGGSKAAPPVDQGNGSKAAPPVNSDNGQELLPLPAPSVSESEEAEGPTVPKAVVPKAVVLAVATPSKKSKSVQKEVVEKGKTYYRKEYYKNDNKFGFKRFEAGQKAKQVFACGHKAIPKSELQDLACKVLHDLQKCAGNRSKEEEIELLAKHKSWKLAQLHQPAAS